MNYLAREAGMEDALICDSAGTIDYHTGKPADERMRRAAKEHGYHFEGSARPVSYDDLKEFDLILAMDRSNLADLEYLDQNGKHRDKLALFTSFCRADDAPQDVPDPYYGGEEGFHTVIHLIEDGCRGILEKLKAI